MCKSGNPATGWQDISQRTIAVMSSTTYLSLWLLLGLPALLALWTLARDLYDERRTFGTVSSLAPRSRLDEVQTRAQMLQQITR